MTEGEDPPRRLDDDDGMDMEQFLTEPNSHPVSVDHFFDADKLNISESESLTRQGRGVVDADDDGGDGDEKLQIKKVAVGNDNGVEPSTEDYLLDTEFIDKDSEDVHHKGLSFEKLNSDAHSSGYSGSESSVVGVSESSSVSNGKSGFKNGRNNHALHGGEKWKDDRKFQEKENTEQKSPIIYTSQKRRMLQSRLELSSPHGTYEMDLPSFSKLHRDSEEASTVSNHRKTKTITAASHTVERLNDSDEDTPVKNYTESSSQKRSRKPPVRYIDEYTNHVPFSDEKDRTLGTSMDKIRNVRTFGEHDNGHETLKSYKPSRDKSHIGVSLVRPVASNRVTPYEGRISVSISKEFSPVTTLDSDEESDSDTLGNFSSARNRFGNDGDRRKNQKVWTIPEVVKLVDGIAQFGVGHWTEIQRRFFPTSTYRTPVDLRDKWRNLLKASNASMQNDQEEERDEELLKNGHRQLPIDLLQRVSELSRLHPYPIKRAPKPKYAPKYHSKRK